MLVLFCALLTAEFVMPSSSHTPAVPEALRALAFDLGPNPTLVFTGEGLERAARLFQELFGKGE